MIIKPRKKLFLAIITFIITFALNHTLENKIYAMSDYYIEPQKNVLILNSYNQGLAWTRTQNLGIIDTIKDSYKNCSILIENMDWKNYPSINNLNYLKEYYRYKYQFKSIDVIIATDDAAFNFALQNRKQIFSDAPIVFSGVNKESLSLIEGKYNNYTGIIETIDPAGTIKIALELNPSLKNVYILYDNSESGISTGKLVEEKIKQMEADLQTIPLNDLTFTEIMYEVENIKEDSIILITSYYSDAAGNIIEFDNASKTISNLSKVPVYHLYDFGLDNGAFGGDMLSGNLQGSNAANLTARILKGEKADNISIVSSTATIKAFDYNQLQRFDIPLSRLPKNCQIINKPFSFFETYKDLVLGVLFIFFILIIFLVVLLIYIRKIKRMRKEMVASNEELTQIYEELVASDEELKVQLEEVSSIKESLSASEEKYTYLALHDALTGLPNRRSLYEDAKKIFNSRVNNRSNNISALLFLDMDNFKYVNDTMGHDFGDELIKKVSKKLTAALEDNCTIYRLGGDEFIILTWESSQSQAEKLAQNIISNSKEEFEIEGISIHCSFSIGISIYPKHGENIEELIQCADIAMYKAKEEGRNRYIVYDSNMNQVFAERMTIEKYLHTAMEKNEFEVYFQPQLDLRSNKISGFEALLRWKSSELGVVPPLKFIKVAEDTHIIIPLGEWVLIQACTLIKSLNDNGYKGLTVSVNISTLQLLQSDFAGKVKKIIESFELDPSCIELEITETVLIESFELVNKKLQVLSSMGIGIALDDFGKGYSFLSYLRQLPISTLKIDKCFVDEVALSNEEDTITHHIIKMGKSMGLSIIAEGVENQEQLNYLNEYDCDKIQGYFFSKPLSKSDLFQLLNSEKWGG